LPILKGKKKKKEKKVRTREEKANRRASYKYLLTRRKKNEDGGKRKIIQARNGGGLMKAGSVETAKGEGEGKGLKPPRMTALRIGNGEEANDSSVYNLNSEIRQGCSTLKSLRPRGGNAFRLYTPFPSSCRAARGEWGTNLFTLCLLKDSFSP